MKKESKNETLEEGQRCVWARTHHPLLYSSGKLSNSNEKKIETEGDRTRYNGR